LKKRGRGAGREGEGSAGRHGGTKGKGRKRGKTRGVEEIVGEKKKKGEGRVRFEDVGKDEKRKKATRGGALSKAPGEQRLF